MKKTFLLVVACIFTSIGAQAQNSEVEAFTQPTKAQQFKENNSFIKETQLYRFHVGSSGNLPHLIIDATLFTDLKSGEQVVALNFTGASVELDFVGFIGYLDMDQVDDLILALETISSELKNYNKKAPHTISYTAPGGIDVFATNKDVTFRKKWLVTNEYGIQSYKYGDSYAIFPAKNIEEVISSIKEAQTIAKQSIGQ